MSTAMRTGLGAGALFLGGLTGGWLGGALFRTAEGPAAVVPGDRSSPAGDGGLRAAIEELTAELRRSRLAAPDDEGLREPATGGGGDAQAQPRDFGELIAALERLTQALGQARGSVASGGIGLTPLVLPPPGNRAANLRALLAMDSEEASRQFRLWSYQQVLDHFGQPSDVGEGGRWIYELGDGEKEFTFAFVDGFLRAIWY